MKKDLAKENQELKERLNEAEELLAAIKNGSVDAFVTDDHRVFALTGSDYAYRVVLETMNEGAATLDRDGTIMYCNRHFARIAGLPFEKVVGTPVSDFVNSEDVERLRSILGRSKGGTARDEFKLKRKRGSSVPVLISCSSLELDIPGICLMVTDLTRQKKNELELIKHREHLKKLVKERTKELAGSEERFRLITAATNDAIWDYDLDKKTAWCNEAYNRFLGSPPARVSLFRWWMSNIHPDDRERVFGSFYAACHSDASEWKEEYRIRGASGDWAIVLDRAHIKRDPNGRVVRILGSLLDLTAIKKAEEARRNNEEQLRKAIEAAPIPVIMHAEDGEVLQISRTWIELTGYKKEDIGRFDQWISDVVYGQGSDEVCDYMKELFSSNSSSSKDFDIRVKTGGIRRWSFSASVPGILVDGRRFIVGMALDITERKKYEDILISDKAAFEELVQKRTSELVRVQKELAGIRRLSDIGTLAATVAHELRNPLAAIGMAVLNIKRKAKDQALNKHLVNIDRKVAESDQIINNLLFYSRLRSPVYQNTGLADIIKESIETVRSKCQKDVLIIRNMADLAEIYLEADPVQIKEVFNNILNNSCDAVPADEGEIRIGSEIENGFVKILIEDNGPGIAGDIADKIFDPFFTTKARGTGLGLSVCRQIITMHGGEIGIKKGLIKGTCVFLRLPRERKKKGGKWLLNGS